MRKTFILIAILFHGFGATAVAQETFGFEVGAYGGWAQWRERSFQIGPPQASPPIPSEFEYDDKVVLGTRINFLSQGYWGGEVSYSYQRNTATLTRTSFTPIALDGGVHHFFYNTVLYPFRYRSSRAIPFVTAGIGMAGYKLSDEARARAADPAIYGLGSLMSIDKRFAFNYGGGVKVNVLSHLGVRFDFRHNFSDVPSYGLPKESSNPAQPVLPIQGKLQNFEGSVGIYVYFLK
jgi:opacity protein-like surface antigen